VGSPRTDSSLRPLLDPSLAPLFWHSERAGIDSAWWSHVPFAHWLVVQTKPRVLVELGTHQGVSYSAFCEAVRLSGLPTKCHAVDTWKGDAHAGEYGEEVYEEFRKFHDARYAGFSSILRCTFEEALERIAEGSVDLLHIDGLHTFEAVRHDFTSWLPKLSERAVVLFHDTNERREDFGVWRFWEEVRGRYPSFEFLHGHGLGVLAVGSHPPQAVMELCSAGPEEVAALRLRFSTLGERWSAEAALRSTQVAFQQQVGDARAEIHQLRLAMQSQSAHEHQTEAELKERAEHDRSALLAQLEETRAEAERTISELRRQAEEAAARAALEIQEAQRRASTFAQRADELQAAAQTAMARAAAIESSTIWRATRPLRSAINRLPILRRVARKSYGLGQQVLQRVRHRQVQRARRADIETVKASPLFDAAWYLRHYPDVRKSGMDPAVHYVMFGARENRAPGPRFDGGWYRQTYPDVAASGMNPLVHYIRFGEREGRSTRWADAYARWVQEYDTLTDADREGIRRHIATLTWKPLISVVVPVYNTNERHLVEMIESVRRQLYPHWELCLCDDASTEPHVDATLKKYAALDHRIKTVRRETNGHVCAATNAAFALASGEFVALLDHDDLLTEHALYEIAVELNAHPDADVVYSDSDNIDDSGVRSMPYFKTDWDPDLMLGHNMVSHLGVYRRALVEQIGGWRIGFEGSQDYDLMLRAADATTPDRIRHVPAVLYHWRRGAASPSFSEASLERCIVAARRAIREHLERADIRARVEPAPNTLSFTRVVYELPVERPLVSIIIPTRDRADLLSRCVDGVLARTDYGPLEVIIVDNESREPETLALLSRLAEDPRVRILRYDGPFNFAAMNNRAANEARGEVLVLLNNDVNVRSPQWLEEMVSHALRPGVGAVGAKLLYPDGKVQHAGVVLGVGQNADRAGHFFYGRPNGPGYFGFLALTRRVSAVTGACLAVRRSTFLEVGGFDEVNLPIAYNDVDFCLRLGERGYVNIWTPHAELDHHESASRGRDLDGEHALRLQQAANHLLQRFGSRATSDPHYNPNCSLITTDFAPAFPPRRRKPWVPVAQPAPQSGRVRTLLGDLDRRAHILEIGPSYNPIAPKADGWNTKTLDHATRSELMVKYRGHPGVDVERIEEVDFVWTGGTLVDAIPAEYHGSFDALIASHVLEHTTDLVGFLDAAETLVTPTGVVILALPDKRYCFDYFRPLTTTGDVLDAHAARRSRHTRRVHFNQAAYAVRNSGDGAWGQAPVRELTFFHPLEHAKNVFSTISEDPASPYHDAHAWQFTPSSFELIMLELARLDETDWRVERITPPTGCEFYVWLRRGGRQAASALSEQEFQSRRLALLKQTLLDAQDQINYLKSAGAR
jgi:GT2 family glycosyltransferase